MTPGLSVTRDRAFTYSKSQFEPYRFGSQTHQVHSRLCPSSYPQLCTNLSTVFIELSTVRAFLIIIFFLFFSLCNLLSCMRNLLSRATFEWSKATFVWSKKLLFSGEKLQLEKKQHKEQMLRLRCVQNRVKRAKNVVGSVTYSRVEASTVALARFVP